MDKQAKTTILVYVEILLGIILVAASVPLLQEPQKMHSAQREYSAQGAVHELRVSTYLASLLSQQIDGYSYAELLAIGLTDLQTQTLLKEQFDKAFANNEPIKLTVRDMKGNTIIFTNKEIEGTFYIITKEVSIPVHDTMLSIKMEVYFAD